MSKQSMRLFLQALIVNFTPAPGLCGRHLAAPFAFSFSHYSHFCRSWGRRHLTSSSTSDPCASWPSFFSDSLPGN